MMRPGQDSALHFGRLDRRGDAGHGGCEYRPRAGTLDGLGWFAPYRTSLGVTP